MGQPNAEQSPLQGSQRRQPQPRQDLRTDQRADDDDPKLDSGAAQRSMGPKSPTVFRNIEHRGNVRAFDRETNRVDGGINPKGCVGLPLHGNGLLSRLKRDDEARAILTDRNGGAVLSQRSNVGLRRQFNAKIFTQAALELEIKLGGSLPGSQRHVVADVVNRDGGSVDGFRAADGEVNFFAGPGMPDGNEIGRNVLKDRRQAGDRDIPNRRSHQVPAFHPGIVRFCGHV